MQIDWSKVVPLSLILAAVSGTYWINTSLATKGELGQTADALGEHLKVAGAKADYALDKHMEYLLSQIALLEQRLQAGKASVADRDQLRYLRDELQRLRQMRRGG